MKKRFNCCYEKSFRQTIYLTRMKSLSRNQIFIAIAAVLFTFMLVANPFHVNPNAAKVLAVATLMITLWLGEAMPMPVVALLPLIFFPLMGICKMDDAASPYANSVIFLFLGGFLIGLAVEKWMLHKRIALSIVKLTGTNGNRIVLGFILATGLLSMWLSNTATTMMMFPIAMSVIAILEHKHGEEKVKPVAVCLMLSLAYASNLSIGTIIATPPNGSYVNFLAERYHYNFSFRDWMLLFTPLSLLLLLALYFIMTRVIYPNKIKDDKETDELIEHDLKQLGKLSHPEKRVLWVFCITAFLWITADIINSVQKMVKLDDTIIAMIGAVSLFVVPSKSDIPETKHLLEWADTKKMAWGILLLFGGGLTLAKQLEKAGLIQQLGNWIAGFAGNNVLLLVFTVTIISIFVSEIMSNIAQVIVFAPVVAGISDAMHISPLLLGIPMTLGASCAGMLPMGTPPNAIVFASHKLQLKDMVKTGFIMNIVSAVLITLFCYYLMPLIVPNVPLLK